LSSRIFYLLRIFMVIKFLALLTSCCWAKVSSSLSGLGSYYKAWWYKSYKLLRHSSLIKFDSLDDANLNI
jgi:hypothetical protein